MLNKNCVLCSKHVFRAEHSDALHWQLENQNIVGRVLARVIERKREAN